MTDEAFPWIAGASVDNALTHPALETQFPRPWTVEHRFQSFAVFDANHRPLGFFYFHNGSDRLYPPNCLSREDAWHLATSFAKFGDTAGSAGGQTKRGAEAQFLSAVLQDQS